MSYTAKEFRKKYKMSLRRYRAMCRFRQRFKKTLRQRFNKGQKPYGWKRLKRRNGK